MSAAPVIHKRGDRMKSYEAMWRQTLPARSYVILRVDGRAFHTLTRNMAKPFDPSFINAMDQTAIALCEEIQGCQFAYVQSDEISVLVTDFNANQEQWFGGVIQKMTSVAAATASVSFNRWPLPVHTPLLDSATFDGRVFSVPNRQEAINYFLWRQADCHRNAISMIAEAHFSSKQLLHVPVSARMDMLAGKGVDVLDYPAGARLGRVTVRVAEEADITYTRKDNGETLTERVTRHRWEAHDATWFDWDKAGFLELYVPKRDDETPEEDR